ncbi:MAG: hypothetical protein DRJ03_17135 [Chloroflexi bacterium]|nr:MAG: hypothetical protein DRJ03_17135 [Chloroflexota bacterium]RLI51565.1 MAG: hypothetical protein DRP09_19120 [Candidatus Thorarchaeota archaeon]
MSDYRLLVALSANEVPEVDYYLRKSDKPVSRVYLTHNTYLENALKRIFLVGKRILNPQPAFFIEVEVSEREARVFEKICKCKLIRRKWSIWRDIVKEKDPLKKLEELLPKYILREKLEK